MLRLGATPVPEAVLGDVSDAGGDRRAGVAGPQLPAGDPDVAVAGRPDAGDRLGELALAVSGDPGDTDDLAGSHGERHVFQGLLATIAAHAQTLDLERGCAAGRGRPLDPAGELDLPPDHQRRELARAGAAATTSRPIVHLAAP